MLLSLRFSAWRDPDVFNDYLLLLLKHADVQSLAAIEAYVAEGQHKDARIVVRSGQARYEISRYCPHRGQDLGDGGVVENGVIRCLAHGLIFELTTGACLNSDRFDPIATRRLDDVDGDQGDFVRPASTWQPAPAASR
jgi:UDP-MurNAc hydroxylase